MNIQEFVKDIGRMIRDYKWTILVVTIVVAVISVGSYLFLTEYEMSSNMTVNEEEETGEELYQVGTIDVFSNSNFDRIQLEPYLLEDITEKINEWGSFNASFALNTGEPELEESEISTENYLLSNADNPVEFLLGLEPAAEKLIERLEGNDHLQFTFEMNPNTGNVWLVRTQDANNDYQVGVNISDEAEQLGVSLPEDTSDLANVQFNMNTGGNLAEIQTLYNWETGIDETSPFSNKIRDFTVTNLQNFTPIDLVSPSGGVTMISILPTIVVGIFGGFILAVGVVFLIVMFNKKIKYSFTYGWKEEDLYLKFDKNDTEKQISYDLLQSDNTRLTVLTQNPLSEEMENIVSTTNQKLVNIYSEISDIQLNEKVEEFVFIIQRNLTDKDWYQRQRKHLKVYRNTPVKIIEK